MKGGSPRRFPVWPLLAMLATQTLATMAAYSLPAVAPAVARRSSPRPSTRATARYA